MRRAAGHRAQGLTQLQKQGLHMRLPPLTLVLHFRGALSAHTTEECEGGASAACAAAGGALLSKLCLHPLHRHTGHCASCTTIMHSAHGVDRLRHRTLPHKAEPQLHKSCTAQPALTVVLLHPVVAEADAAGVGAPAEREARGRGVADAAGACATVWQATRQYA